MEARTRLIRWSPYAPLILSAVLVWFPPRAASVSLYDGRYFGTIECDQISGYTRGPLKTEFFLKVADGYAEYERRHLNPTASLGSAERGAGSVSSTGEVSLTGSAGDQTGSYEATYRGQIDDKSFRLSGVQVWQLPDKANYRRPCTINLRAFE